jgi:enamine deaminase RidA (YjgF/YER057c/UK114 family)
VHVIGAGAGQAFLVVSAAPMAEPRQAARAAYRHLGHVLVRSGGCIVQERLFGDGSARAAVLAGRAEALANFGMTPDWPVTCVQVRPAWGRGLAGVLIRAVRPAGPEDAVWTVVDGTDAVGRGWRRLGMAFLALQAVTGPAPADPAAAPDDRCGQAATIARAEEILRGQGLSGADVARTWLYPAGMLDLLAVAGSTGGGSAVRPIDRPDPTDAFGRDSPCSPGMVVEEADVNVIEVSRTAAIDAAGRSVHPGDARSQIDATLERIESLIGPEGATLKDVCSGTAFVKRPEHASVFRRALVARGLEPLPVVCVVADLCGPEALFEMDAEVAVGPGRKG